jgi:hypothetical protein
MSCQDVVTSRYAGPRRLASLAALSIGASPHRVLVLLGRSADKQALPAWRSAAAGKSTSMALLWRFSLDAKIEGRRFSPTTLPMGVVRPFGTHCSADKAR